jgi:hypothetical protein
LIVTALDVNLIPVQLSKPPTCWACASPEGHVTNEYYCIVGLDIVVPIVKQRGIHFEGRLKRPTAILNDVGVVEVWIGNEPGMV